MNHTSLNMAEEDVKWAKQVTLRLATIGAKLKSVLVGELAKLLTEKAIHKNDSSPNIIKLCMESSEEPINSVPLNKALGLFFTARGELSQPLTSRSDCLQSSVVDVLLCYTSFWSQVLEYRQKEEPRLLQSLCLLKPVGLLLAVSSTEPPQPDSPPTPRKAHPHMLGETIIDFLSQAKDPPKIHIYLRNSQHHRKGNLCLHCKMDSILDNYTITLWKLCLSLVGIIAPAELRLTCAQSVSIPHRSDGQWTGPYEVTIPETPLCHLLSECIQKSHLDHSGRDQGIG